jgi:hypothetical protein
LGISIGAISLAVASLVAGTFMTMRHQELVYKRLSIESEKQSLQQLIFGTRYQEIKDAITNFNGEVSALTSIQNTLFSVPKLLEKIMDSLPSGISISSLDFSDSDLSVEMSGVSKDRNTLLSLQNDLEKAEYIEEVIAPRSNFDEKEDISFYLKLKLNFTELDIYGQTD